MVRNQYKCQMQKNVFVQSLDIKLLTCWVIVFGLPADCEGVGPKSELPFGESYWQWEESGTALFSTGLAASSGR